MLRNSEKHKISNIGFEAEVLQTSLSKQDEAKLWAAFGAEE